MNSRTKVKPGIGKISIDPKDPNSQVTYDDKIKAKLFSDFFTSVQTEEPEGKCPRLEKVNITHPMQKIIINRQIILKILNNLKPDKSHKSIDKMSPRLLRELAEELVDVVVGLFQSSIDSGKLPHDWLRALITVIFKKGKKNLVGNYRPISLTCVLCKCLETIIMLGNHHKVSSTT